MQRVINVLCGLLLVVCSCNSKKQLQAEDYVRYFIKNDNAGKIVTTTADYQLQLVTPECIAAKDVLQEKKIFDAAAYLQRLSAISGNTYVFIRVYNKGESQMPKDQQVLYYQQYAQQQMKLVIDGQVPKMPEYVNYEDSYGLAPYNTIIACFNCDLKSVKKELQFIYNDAMTGNSNIQLTYTQKELSDLPQIKI